MRGGRGTHYIGVLSKLSKDEQADDDDGEIFSYPREQRTKKATRRSAAREKKSKRRPDRKAGRNDDDGHLEGQRTMDRSETVKVKFMPSLIFERNEL